MKDVRSSKALFIFVLLTTFVPVLQGATLLTENWNSGTINSAVWKVLGNTAVTNLENLGGGDYALALRGYQDPAGNPYPVWGDDIYSLASFARGSSGGGLSVQFKVWYMAGINVQAGMHAGWHYDNTAAHV